MINIILSILICLNHTAFDAPPEAIIGQWKVVKIHGMPKAERKEQQEAINQMGKAFLSSKFYFKSDQRFSFNTNIPIFNIKNGYWKLVNGESVVSVYDLPEKDKNKALLMELSIEKREGKIFFLLAEIPFVLEVEKM